MNSDRVRELAETLMENHAYNVEFMTIGETMSCGDDLAALARDDFDAFQRAVDDAINHAVITISWPSEPA